MTYTLKSLCDIVTIDASWLKPNVTSQTYVPVHIKGQYEYVGMLDIVRNRIPDFV